jgi:hypothetical protein
MCYLVKHVHFYTYGTYNTIASAPLDVRNIPFIHFPVGSQLEYKAPFGVSVITHTIRHTVGLPWTIDQPVAEAFTYAGQHNI